MNADQLQKIYDREFHFEILVVWDGGFVVTIGDGLCGGYGTTETRYFDTAREALDWLDSASTPKESPQT